MTDQVSLLSTLITKAVLEIEGQKVPVPLEVVVTDDMLRRALAVSYPGAINAKFERQEVGNTLEIKVIKQLERKG